MSFNHHHKRSGNVAIFALILMVAMMAFVAFAVDIGCIVVTRTELQRSADASSVAAAWQLIDEGGWSGSPTTVATAAHYVSLNKVGTASMELGGSDVEIGQLVDPSNPADEMTFGDVAHYNAVQVRVRRTSDQNGEAPLFFARVLGHDSAAVEGQATAAFLNNVAGFRTPDVPCHKKLKILPFALDEQTWDDRLHNAIDNWKWSQDGGEDGQGEVLNTPDLCYEVNLFPQGTGSPGNRGTVDIGSNNNSTADIARQIIEGINEDDLAYHGGELKMSGENYELNLNGDTGISAGVKDELQSIRGQCRCIPIFRTVVGPGNNAQYTIVKWVGVRIMEVKLTGPMNKKRVMVQPAKCVMYGALPAPEGAPQMSDFVYSPPWIVR